MKKRFYIIIMFVLCLLDQISKLYILKNFEVDSKKVIIKNFLKIFYVKNTGVSFGMFSGMKLPIIIVSVIIIIYMIYEFVKTEDKFNMFSIGLIIAGAFGNLIDRLLRGYVVDFISFTIMNKEMSIFNFADSFITIGVLLYAFNIIRKDFIWKR